jgi:NitT/TauT family transport system ATP-binding protein
MSVTMELSEPRCAAPERAAETLLELRAVSRRFENGTLALREVSLAISRGSFVSLLGASGCGKSTILRLIAGLLKPSEGALEWPAAQQRPRLGYVFQDPTLMPWSTALGNVMLPLVLAGTSRRTAEERALRALADVGLSKFARSYPRELSGGMKMRVSLARALVTEPEILLLDEPFAALDEITRGKLNNDLAQLWRQRKFTVVFVTHSVFEAAYLSQHVVVLAREPGRVFAECRLETEAVRDEAFRLSPEYLQICADLSAKLKEAMG